MPEVPVQFDHGDYTVGWICALPETELVAAGAMLDEEHPVLPAADPKDMNSYLLGKIGQHNVVIACLPAETNGKVSAATVAKDMLRSFPAVRFGLMVGIGAGVPFDGSQGNDIGCEVSEEDSENELEEVQDIRLGDVVVSLHSKSTEAVVQYDFGKSVQRKGFHHIGGRLNKPPNIVLSAISMLRAQHIWEGSKIPQLIAIAVAKNPLMATRFRHPGPEKDRLFKSDVIHEEGKKSCKSCCGPDNINLVKRKERHNNDPQIHYGTIGSADRVVTDAILRDKWAQQEKIKCFEMEAAGLMDSFPCLVIRGICAYADTHKTKVWQPYAAATAAAYAKELLLVIPAQGVRGLPWIKQSLGKIAANVEMMRSNYEKMESSSILDWLTPISYGDRQTDNLRRRQAGTGQWLLNSTEFRNWVNVGNQTLFCPGIPGAGKTIMAAIVIDELYNKFQSDASVGIAYVYCNFRQHHEQIPEVLLASLLKQLSQQQSSLPESVQLLHDHHHKRNTQPTLSEFSKVLQSVATMYSRVFIVVDALDECQEHDGCRTRFLADVFALQAKSGANILVTSRFVPEIEKMFEGSIRIEIRASGDDVQSYLDANISRLPAFVTTSLELQEEIKTAIVKAVDGMFLLARLHFDSLAGKTSPKSIRTTLRVLTTGSDVYDYAYKEAVERIEAQHAEQGVLAKQIISWIVCAKRPLSPIELQHALAVEPGTRELDQDNFSPIELMVSVCAGLVMIDEANSIIRLVHYTTQQYFERTQNYWFPDAETDITRTCITYMSFGVFESGPCRTYVEFADRLQRNILFDYAARNWVHHARMSLIEGDEIILRFLQNDANLSACIQAMRGARRPSELEVGIDMTGLDVAAYFGLVRSTAALFKEKYSPRLKTVFSRTPLNYAAENGHQEVVKLLLGKGVDPNVHGRGKWVPLHYAAYNGHQAVVKILLDKGAHPGIIIVDFDGDSVAPLHNAAKNGHEEIVKLLLDQGVDPNAKDRVGLTPLYHAAKNGYQKVVKLLLDQGVDPSINKHWLPLHRAAENGRQDVVKLLLGYGIDPTINDQYMGATLHYAVKSHAQTLVKVLLDDGDDHTNLEFDYATW